MITHGVARVAGITRHRKRVLACFTSDEKSAVVGRVEYAVRSCFNETMQLVTSFVGQLMKQVIANPVVAS